MVLPAPAEVSDINWWRPAVEKRLQEVDYGRIVLIIEKHKVVRVEPTESIMAPWLKKGE